VDPYSVLERDLERCAARLRLSLMLMAASIVIMVAESAVVFILLMSG